MNEKKAQEMLEKWMRRLSLDGWRVTLKVNALPCDMTLEACGEAEWAEPIKVATIRILDERCYGERNEPFFFEKTLIHELLHLKFSLLDNSGNDLQDRLVHQTIDDLARAFYATEIGAPVFPSQEVFILG